MIKAAGIPSRRRDDTNHADNEVQIMTSSSGSAKSSSSNHYLRLHGHKRSYHGIILLLLLLLLLLLYTLSVTQQPYFRLKKMSSYYHESVDKNSTTATQSNFTTSTPSQAYNSSLDTSNTPLFYHISPGSTGSRTLYHAACMAGLPSVHHKSFCISSNRGVNGVSSRVVDGVHAHFGLLRLYQIAYKCCSYWSKGFIIAEESSDGTGRKNIRMKEEGDDNRSTIDLCTMSLDNWSRDIQIHLSKVLQSDIIGLFDTPYPLLASQVLNFGAKQRTLPTIVAMTKRDVASWAQSRSENHNLMLCKQDFSYHGLGASEFDILGCVDRAMRIAVAKKKDATKEVGGNETNDRLYFWDVFEYRSRFENASSEFLSGLEAQMEHHQTIYEPLAMYSPNFFGSSTVNTSTTKLTDRQVTDDIQHLIINQQRTEMQGSSNITTNTSSSWSTDFFKAPLTCGGTVEYDFVNDTFSEFYKHSKGCDGGLSSNVEETPAGERIML